MPRGTSRSKKFDRVEFLYWIHALVFDMMFNYKTGRADPKKVSSVTIQNRLLEQIAEDATDSLYDTFTPEMKLNGYSCTAEYFEDKESDDTGYGRPMLDSKRVGARLYFSVRIRAGSQSYEFNVVLKRDIMWVALEDGMVNLSKADLAEVQHAFDFQSRDLPIADYLEKLRSERSVRRKRRQKINERLRR